MHSQFTVLRAVIVSAALSGLTGASRAQEIGLIFPLRKSDGSSIIH